jgi:hypothetical protein
LTEGVFAHQLSGKGGNLSPTNAWVTTKCCFLSGVKIQFLPHSEYTVTTTKTISLKLFREITAASCKDRMKEETAPEGQNAAHS